MSDFTHAFPNSTKILVDGPQQVRVPMREIALSGGEPPLRVYDASSQFRHQKNNAPSYEPTVADLPE